MIRRAFAVGVVAVVASAPRTPALPQFLAHEIATGLRGGYQVVVSDVNHDGKPDLIAVASGLPELAWFENPSWTKHIIATGVSAPINVAAADLDGDGIPEIALAYGFSTNPAQSSGIVSLFTHGANVNDPWTARELDRTPAAHRLRWFTTNSGAKLLINAPLAGATAQQPDYKGATPIYFYRAPEWKRETVTTEEQGVVHAIEPIRWENAGALHLYAAGFMGIHDYAFVNDHWSRAELTAGDPAPWPKGGSSDVAIGHVGREQFIAAIEPWHGNQVSVYRERGGHWVRRVIDTTGVDGHTLVIADFDKDGRDEIVFGQRGGTQAVWIYSASATGDAWTRSSLDDGRMAAAGCAAADLNGDGRIDIACIGTATANLTWYENRGAQ